MNRRRLAPFLLGVAAIAVAALWALAAGLPLMPSYLAAWLFWAALPIGAVLVLLVLAVGDGRGARLLAPLFRPLALTMPLAALLFLPVLFGLHGVYAWTHGHGPGAPFGQAWLQPGVFVARAIAYLLLLVLLALLAAPGGRAPLRRGSALLALFVFALVGTLAAIDWTMSLDPTFHSGTFGVLLMASQAAAATAGVILMAWAAGAPLPRQAASLLATASAAWLGLHFLQYLVVWSADLPAEAAWYLTRDAGAGALFGWLALLLGFAAPVAVATLPFTLRMRALPAAAILVLLAHAAEALWLVAPAFHQDAALACIDLLMLLGLGGIGIGVPWWLLASASAYRESVA